MKIVHAVSNEHGSVRGGAKGDQTGREIRVDKWYDRKSSGGWTCYLEPLDGMVAHRAQKIAQILAKNDTFGYDQVDRWSGLHAYKAQDGRAGDFDCSSLVISCYILAGLELPAKGYSGDIVKRFTATGKFRAHYDDAHLTTDKLATAGGVYVAEKKHVCIIIDEEDAAPEEPTPDAEVIYIKGNIRVRVSPISGKTVRILRKGTTEKIYGADDATGWYKVVDGYVTSNSKYVEKQ